MASSEEQIARWLIVIDEYGDLAEQKEIRKELESALTRLGQKARACGIHLIVCTQKPAAKILSTSIRSNLGAQIALRVKDSKDSAMILGESGAEKLLGSGDALLNTTQGLTRFQCAVIKPD